MKLAVACLAALLGGCGCGCGCGCDNHGGGRDAALDSGRDASVVDAARDATSDAHDARPDGAVGQCPVGEDLVSPVAVPHDGARAACGEGCRQLTWAPLGATDFDVYADRLAYASLNHVNVGILDLASGEEVQVEVSDPARENLVNNGPVAVYGSTVVYSTYSTSRPFRGWIWRIDTDTWCRHQLKELVGADESYTNSAKDLDLDGTNVVWYAEPWGSGSTDVFSYDFATGSETRLTSDECCTVEVRMWGRQVVYQGWADGPRGIHLLDLDGGPTERVWIDGHEQSQPAIQGNRVVFTYQGDRPRYDHDVHGVDLLTEEHFVAVEHEWHQDHADVYGDLVAWEDYRNDPDPDGVATNINIYARDLTAGEEVQVTALPGLETRPRVWERTVFFRHRIQEAGGNLQIWAIEVPP